MKKISILSLHLGYGGIEKSIVALANLLVEDYDVEIACTYKLYDEGVFTLNNKVKVKYLTNVQPNKKAFLNSIQKKHFFQAFKEGCKSVKILALKKIKTTQYIKQCNSDTIIATRDIFDKWLSKYGKKEIKKIGWEHNHHHGNMKYANKIVKSCKKLNYLVLVSNELKNFYQQKMCCKCVYIPNMLDKIPLKKSLLKQKRLISVGRLSPEKGYIDLLKIFNSFSKKYPDWHLDIVGDGFEKDKLELYIKEHHLHKKVMLHGFQKKEYINKLLEQSSIYLMTSYTESFGIVLIEAMSYGVPCIAFSSAEGANEIIIDGVNGYLIANRDVKKYQEKMEYLIENTEIRKNMGQKACYSVKQYTALEVIKLWEKIL